MGKNPTRGRWARPAVASGGRIADRVGRVMRYQVGASLECRRIGHLQDHRRVLTASRLHRRRYCRRCRSSAHRARRRCRRIGRGFFRCFDSVVFCIRCICRYTCRCLYTPSAYDLFSCGYSAVIVILLLCYWYCYYYSIAIVILLLLYCYCYCLLFIVFRLLYICRS